MTKEQLIDIFARFILENSAGYKYFYPKDVNNISKVYNY